MDDPAALLKTKYNITAQSVSPVAGGFSAKAAYRVTGADSTEYFVKVYDKSLPTTMSFVERVDLYMPVLDWLSASETLCGRVLTPVRAVEGKYKAETDCSVYVVFLFISGKVPGIEGISRSQTVELAEILAHLHDISGTVPFDKHLLAENTALPFCENLSRYLAGAVTKKDKLSRLVSPHRDVLDKVICETLYLRGTIRRGYTPLVLCHGDAHGNNVIQGKRLVLADWEDLRRAPAEADLFIYAWHPHGDALLEAYCAARDGYCINSELLRFYTLRRRLEDIWVDIQRMTEESPDDHEKEELLGWINQSIQAIVNGDGRV